MSSKKRISGRRSGTIIQFQTKIISRKTQISWSGPFRITQVFSHGVVELVKKENKAFKVNGQRLKPYLVKEARLKSVSCTLTDPTP